MQHDTNYNTMMKKIFILLTVLVATLTVQAEGYTYLTFETTDGAKASVAVENLTLTIYDLQGHKVSKEQMKKGVYIVKTNSRTYKMVVR